MQSIMFWNCTSRQYRQANYIAFICLFAVPALNISTNLLVHQYNGPFLLMGESLPQVSCIPSDLRAPVRWTTRMGMVPADYQITFSPRGFSHIATFARVYNPTPPNRTETLFCDLVNVDQPDQPVSPQNVTVRFIQSKKQLLYIFLIKLLRLSISHTKHAIHIYTSLL